MSRTLIRLAFAQNGCKPAGKGGRDRTDGLSWVVALVHDLAEVDARQLRVLLASRVGGEKQCGAQHPVARLVSRGLPSVSPD
jgi:hypothetical protein